MQWNERTPLSVGNLNNLENRIAQANANVTAGKQSVFDAVKSKGQTANSKDFQDLVLAINRIKTAQGNAAVNYVLYGKTFTNSTGELLTGTMPNRTGVVAIERTARWPDGGLAVYPLEGYYSGIVGKDEIKISSARLQATESSLRAENIMKGVNIFGVNGSIPVNPGLIDGTNHIATAQQVTGIYSADNIQRIYLRPGKANSRQVLDGDIWVTAPAATLLPQNIKNGINILGVIGTLPTECIEKIQEFSFAVSQNSNKNVGLGVSIDWSRSVIVPTISMRERGNYSNKMVKVIDNTTVNVSNRCSNSSSVSFRVYTFYSDTVKQTFHGFKSYTSSEMDISEGDYKRIPLAIGNSDKCLPFATGIVYGSSYDCRYTPRAYSTETGIEIYGISTAGRFNCDLAWSVIEFK